MAYTPTAWNDGGVPDMSAANLNHAETQYQKILDDTPVDDIAANASLRTLGAGAQQAAAGDHGHT